MTLLAFEEGYAERVWGGNTLRTLYGKDTPASAPIGEAWLVADRSEHVSVVADGPQAGQTLRELLEEDAAGLLGSRARLTPHGRFPCSRRANTSPRNRSASPGATPAARAERPSPFCSAHPEPSASGAAAISGS